MTTRSLVTIATTLTLTGCGGESERGGFLAPSDLQKPARVEALSAEQLADKLDAKPLFLHADREDADTAEGCEGQALGALTFRGVRGEIWIASLVDYTACAAQAEGGKVDEATLEILVHLTADGVDFTRFDGKTWDEAWTAVKAAVKGRSSTAIWNYRSTVRTPGGTTRVVYASQRPDGDPCEVDVDDGVERHGACRETLIRERVGANGKAEVALYDVAETRGLEALVGDEFYRAGDVRFTFGDWSGAMVMQDDASAPTWEARRAGKTLHGVFEPRLAD